jgi:hypothetical protein
MRLFAKQKGEEDKGEQLSSPCIARGTTVLLRRFWETRRKKTKQQDKQKRSEAKKDEK